MPAPCTQAHREERPLHGHVTCTGKAVGRSPMLLREVLSIYREIQKDRRQNDWCVIVLWDITMHLWFQHKNRSWIKEKWMVGMTTAPSQNLKSYQVQLWMLGQMGTLALPSLSLSLSLSVSLSLFLSLITHTHTHARLRSDIHMVNIHHRCTSHKGERKMLFSKNKHTGSPTTHLTRLQDHLVSDTKNDPLPGGNLHLKVAFLLYSSISPPPGWNKLCCLWPKKNG